MSISEEPKCMCKDRAASACPGEWEPGCDLGSNPKFVRVAGGISKALQNLNAAKEAEARLSRAIDLLKAAHSALDEVMEGRVVFDIAAFLKEVSE